VPLHPTSWRPQEWLRRRAVFGVLSFVLSFVLHTRSSFFSFVISLVSSRDRPGRRAIGCLQRAATARTADRKTGQNVRRNDLPRSNASMIKQKKNIFLGHLGGGRRGASNEPQLRGQRTGNGLYITSP